MKALVQSLAAAAALIGVATPAQAAITYTVDLTRDQEPPPSSLAPTLTSTGDPRPVSFGTATITLNDAMTSLSFVATIFNIDVTGAQTADSFDNLVAAHIHSGPTLSATGTFPVSWGFFGMPDNDISPSQLVVTPFASGVGGTFSSTWDTLEGNGGRTLLTELEHILAGRAYINFHTVQFGGGEIRGNFPAVPEPSTWAMMLLGFGAIGYAMRRRRSAAPKAAAAI